MFRTNAIAGSVQIEVTNEGKELYERAVEAQAAKEGIVAEALDPKQQDQLNDLLRRLMLGLSAGKRRPEPDTGCLPAARM